MHQNNKAINVTLVKSNGINQKLFDDESNVDLHDRSEIFNNHQQIQNRPAESIFENQNRPEISEVDIKQKQPRALFDMLLETLVYFFFCNLFFCSLSSLKRDFVYFCLTCLYLKVKSDGKD